MNLIRLVNSRRLIVLCLIILVAFPLTGRNLIVSHAQQEEMYERLATVLNNVKSARYRYSTNEGPLWEIGFRVLGEDTVGGEATWMVEWIYTEEGEDQKTATLWISKSTGRCVQAEIDGVPSEYPEMESYYVITPYFTWIWIWETTWDLPTVYHYWDIGYGRLIFEGSETGAFGPTSLLIYKYRWEGFINAPEGFRGAVEWWFAPVSFGTLLVHFRVESDEEWWQTELSSIELVSPQPRPNIVIDPSVDKTQLTPNEEATISITASNTGNAMGTHNLTITVGGEVKKSWLVVLNPGETKSFSHKLSFAATGSYTVRVGDRTFTITVSTTLPARFDVSGLNINPSSIKVGQSSTISVTVKNTGGESGSYTVTLKVNNQAVDTRTGTLSPDQSETVSFTYTPTSEGTYSIDVNGLTGSLTVSKEEGTAPAEIPWLIIIGVVVAAVAVIIVVILLRRKPTPQPAYTPPPPPPPPQ